MEPPTVLVIGDTPEIRRIFAGLLPREGFRVLTARSVPEGLVLYRQESPSIVMMDIRIGIRAFPAFVEVDPNVKCCFMSSGGYSKSDIPGDEGVAVVTRPFCLPDVGQALWALVTRPDVILHVPSEGAG